MKASLAGSLDLRPPWRRLLLASAHAALWMACAADPTIAPVDLPVDTASVADAAGAIGQQCRLHTDCARALTCLSEASGALSGFAPRGGMCTVACEVNEDCSRIDPLSLCVDLAPDRSSEAYCAVSCDPTDPEPCGPRPLVACVRAIDARRREQYVCVPFCDGPGQCEPDTPCSGETNLCSVHRDTGERSLGEACDLTAASDECQDGYCSPVDLAAPDAPGVCTTRCRLTEDRLCDWPLKSQTAMALCWAGASQTAHDAGVGMCVLGCRCNADCQHPGTVCNRDPSGTVADLPGLCFRDLEGDGGIASCSQE